MSTPNKAYYKDGGVVEFSDLQVLEGLANGLQELTEQEREAYLNPVPVLTIEDLKSNITKKRFEVETGGLVMPDGVEFCTSRESQALTKTALLDAQELLRETVEFFTLGRWQSLSALQLGEVVKAMAALRQDCRDVERQKHEEIDALGAKHANDANALQDALAAFDVDSGWPSRVVK